MRQREAELRAAQSLVREKEAALSQEQQRSSGERDTLQGRLADKVAPRPRPRPRPAAVCSQGCAPVLLQNVLTTPKTNPLPRPCSLNPCPVSVGVPALDVS